MTAILWISLILLAAASILPKELNSRFVLGGAGWVFLSIHWSMQPGTYIELQDYVNGLLVMAAAAASLFIAYIMFNARDKKEGGYEVLISLARASSVGGLMYFLFAEIGFLTVNGMMVEIILACTAIVSIALFSGIISSAKGASTARKFKAFMISVPVIYSFHISEHIITKAGSLLALFLISYMVLKTLPEVLVCAGSRGREPSALRGLR